MVVIVRYVVRPGTVVDINENASGLALPRGYHVLDLNRRVLILSSVESRANLPYRARSALGAATLGEAGKSRCSSSDSGATDKLVPVPMTP